MPEVQTASRAAGARRRRDATAGRATPSAEPVLATFSEVHVVGRVSSAAQDRELPSGDVIVSFRVVVDRPPLRRSTPAGVRLPVVDTLTCVAWTARVKRAAAALSAGDVVEVHGALRSRWWRGATGLSSRTEVEVERLRRVSRG
ncbi:MAG TPA: single-stranded DNA-binding protein [Mycobacteriales bacterium]|nr:single-stranded DNA-binding protein [Mycobacteriales bacterium]